MRIRRLKNRLVAVVAARVPAVGRRLVRTFSPRRSGASPWTPLRKPLSSCTVALVTTAGVHHASQRPFDMEDPDGDSSWRELDPGRADDPLTITHDYYDHRDADRDINVVFPIDRLREFEREGLVGRVARSHYGFMGHITGGRVRELVEETAPEVASRLAGEGVDAVLLTPG